MKKVKEVYFCDRCKKEIEDYSEEKHNICDRFNAYFYDLCENCKEDYKEYQAKLNGLEKTYKYISEKYKFGKYLFEKDEAVERGKE